MIRKESINRARELDRIADINNSNKCKVEAGTDKGAVERSRKNKERIQKYFKATEAEWEDHRWQMKNRITDVDMLNDIMNLDEKRYLQIKKVSEHHIWSVSPYYLSLIDFDDIFDPIGLICLPNILECAEEGELDPMAEEYTNPAEAITRRYPDRVIINVTNMCGMYCRYCQRKRNFSRIESQKTINNLTEAIEYIANTPSIRDVLVTGGDPFTLSTSALENILSAIRSIKHVEIIRIGTRMPVTVPQRVDAELTNMLKKYHPLYINTHFNHPREVTKESMEACRKLADAGIPLGNQSVLLNGINNDKYIFLRLNQELLRCRVKPYYIFHAKTVIGATHFHCDIRTGMEIVRFLRGNTTGFAIPQFIVNAPGGLGKVTMQENCYEFASDDSLLLTTWEGNVLQYDNPPEQSIQTLYLTFCTWLESVKNN